MKHLLWALLLTGCQTPPLVNRKLDDIMVQNAALRTQLFYVMEDLRSLKEDLIAAKVIKRSEEQ